MRKNCLKHITSALMMLLFTAASAAGTITTPAEAVNSAGKQRMFTMRLLRDYIMIGEKMQYKNPAADLQKTIASYELSQKELMNYVTDPSLKSELDKIGVKWQEVRKMLGQSPQKELAATYAKTAIDFREVLNTFVDHLTKATGSSSTQSINLSGRLRAVSQALAALYQLRAWEMPGVEKKIMIPMERFRASLDYLESAKVTAAPMQPYLKKLEKIYRFFSVMNTAETFTPTLVIKKTDTMLNLASELTALYVGSDK